MPTKAEQAELQNKLQEVRTMVADMEKRLNGLPYREETKEMREVASKMVTELRKMEHNILAILQMDNKNGNGGNIDGNY